MLAACSGECSNALSIPDTFVPGLIMPTFSSSIDQYTEMPSANREWQMLGAPLLMPHPPKAMCAAHARALLVRFAFIASGAKPCDARKALMLAIIAPSAPGGGAGGGGGGGGGATT